MHFDDSLKDIKRQFEPWRALVVLDDKALRRQVLSWGPQLIRRLSDWPEGRHLADLWACVEVDFNALAELAGETQVDVRLHFRQAQGLGLIYPDGSVASAVREVLTSKFNELKV